MKTILFHRPTANILIGFRDWRHFAGSSPADGTDVTPDVTSDVTIFRNFAILPKCERTKLGPMRYGGAPGPNLVGHLGKGSYIEDALPKHLAYLHRQNKVNTLLHLAYLHLAP